MSTSNSISQYSVTSDAALVAASLGGDQDAFAQIVSRYQRLLCSLAYSATGQLSQSEDLAQETFIEAWRKLEQLRDPEKLRAWLCGILRFKVSRLRRADNTEPVRRADVIDEADDVLSTEQPAPDLAVHKEEQAMLWSALERVPQSYREPLILYYREHQSVEHVAAALDLSEDAVKQRLSRGRKILQEQVLAFVEGALARSTPGKLFTLAVIAALPPLAQPAKAAGVAAIAAKGGLMAKSTVVASVIASMSGFINAVLALRATLDQSRTPLERRTVAKVTIVAFAGAMIFLGALFGLTRLGLYLPEQRIVLAIITQIIVIAGIVVWPVLLLKAMRGIRELRTAERKARPELFSDMDASGSSVGQYITRAKLFGVPLVHIRFSAADKGDPYIFAWIAGGDRAVGILAAWGALAIAPIAVGSISVGVLSVGTLGIGVVSIGTVGVGALSIGCATIAYKAYAWLSALGWQSAQGGGFNIARIAAEGPMAIAQHANDPVARQFLADPHQSLHQAIVYSAIAILSTLPVILYASEVRRRLGQKARGR
ncbi:MAG TPA: sigma-70 family RNA polymerase sigma factor [Opitutaceae bacterium]|nr:sigma-70 family RNA polymerase sigma factor [Opitutaceae bacterium]